VATTVSKSRFKPRALEYFRKIQETGEELILTDHGKPVLRISAYKADPAAALKSLRNSVVRFTDPLKPTGEKWNALK
jgi:antitoxin (DNA-binding transcriptional repressor) of toxin-antitoxin stability system